MKKLLLLLLAIPLLSRSQTLPTDSAAISGSTPTTPSNWRKFGSNVSNYRLQFLAAPNKMVELLNTYQFNNYIGASTQTALSGKLDSIRFVNTTLPTLARKDSAYNINKNGNDILNKATFRSNIDVYSKAESNKLLTRTTKTIIPTEGQTAFTFLELRGQFILEVNRSGTNTYTVDSLNVASDPLKTVSFDSETGVITFPTALTSDEFVKVQYTSSGSSNLVPASIVTTAALNTALADYTKKTDLFSTFPNYFATTFAAGRYASTGTAYDVVASSVTSYSGVFPVAVGDTISFEGLSASFSNANVGIVFNSTGTALGQLLVSDLQIISGGRRIIVPAVGSVSSVGFNIRNEDVANVKIQRGGVIKTLKIKDSLLPTQVTKTSQLTNDNDFLDSNTGAKSSTVFVNPPTYLLNFTLTTGRYSSTGTNFPVVASASNNHSPVYPVTVGDIFAIEGLNTSLASADIGRLFDINGTPIQIINPATDLVTITGGKKYTVPAVTGVAYIGFNVTTGDSPNVKVQKGGVIKGYQIKPELIPGSDPVAAALNGKRVFVEGNSITYGIGTTTKAYHAYLAEWLGLTIINGARSGTGIVKPFGTAVGMYKRMTTIWPSASDIDGISIMCNMNDGFGPFNDGGTAPYPSGLPVGTFADTTAISTYGAMRYMIKYIQANYPLIPVVFIISPPRDDVASNGICYGVNGWFQAHANAIEEVCRNYSVPVLNLYNSSNLKPWIPANNAAYFNAADGVHPNAAGHYILAREIYQFWIKNLY